MEIFATHDAKDNSTSDKLQPTQNWLGKSKNLRSYRVGKGSGCSGEGQGE